MSADVRRGTVIPAAWYPVGPVPLRGPVTCDPVTCDPVPCDTWDMVEPQIPQKLVSAA